MIQRQCTIGILHNIEDTGSLWSGSIICKFSSHRSTTKEDDIFFSNINFKFYQVNDINLLKYLVVLFDVRYHMVHCVIIFYIDILLN